ncbi:MAG: chemotaxis protein CheA, partial [Deltaproteobacteria bacterium]
MSEDIDLREFVAGFIAESDELIAAANAALLDIEAANVAGTPQPRAVRDLFRALHTIKGLAGMIGVDPIVELAHGLEGLVRTADRAGGTLGREAVDVSLRGVAAIAERVRAVAAQQAPAPAPAELMDAIAVVSAGVERSPARAPETPRAATAGALDAPGWDAGLVPADRQRVAANWRAGRRAWRVSFAPSEANAERGITIASVRARLAELGDVIKVLPRATPGEASSVAFDLLVASDASAEALAEAAATAADQLVELAAPQEAREPERAEGPCDAVPGSVADVAGPARDDDGGVVLGRALVRVELARLDELQDQLSLLIVSRFRLEREIAALAERGVDVRALREIANLQGRQLRDLR